MNSSYAYEIFSYAISRNFQRLERKLCVLKNGLPVTYVAAFRPKTISDADEITASNLIHSILLSLPHPMYLYPVDQWLLFVTDPSNANHWV
jgi:hypothetical protein